MASPRIFYFCSRLPGRVQNGLDIRVRNQIKALAGLGPTAVFALAGADEPIDARLEVWRSGSDPAPAHSAAAASLADILSAGRSPYAGRFSQTTALELADAMAGFRPDVVIISGLELMPYFSTIERAGGARIILDLNESVTRTGASIANVIADRVKGLLYRRFAECAKDYEAECVARVDAVWLCSDIEAENFKKAYPRVPEPTVIPNALDVHDYDADAMERDPRQILYTASFSYEPNIDAARFLIDRLMPLLPEFRLVLVGSGAPEWLRARGHDGVRIAGSVPDIRPYLARAGMAVLPIRAGGGTRLKAVEALSAGLPIVSTLFGVEGLHLVPGEHYLRAETPEGFAQACRSLAGDPSLRGRLAAAGAEAARANNSLEALAGKLELALADPSCRTLRGPKA